MTEETKTAPEFTSTDPTEVLASVPHRPSREQTLKSVQDKYPGHISWASDRANFSGCRSIRFAMGTAFGLEAADGKKFVAEMEEAKLGESASTEAVMNLYFSKRANLLVVDSKPDCGDVVLLVTTQLDDEDLEEFQEVQTRVNLEMREWREARETRREAERAKIHEDMRLIEVGRKAETYNLNGRYEDVLAENKALKSKLAFHEKTGE